MNPLKLWRIDMQHKLKRILTQEEAADMLGISVSGYSKMEIGLRTIPEEMKNKMHELLK